MKISTSDTEMFLNLAEVIGTLTVSFIFVVVHSTHFVRSFCLFLFGLIQACVRVHFGIWTVAVLEEDLRYNE